MSPHPDRRLIVNADDFGLSAGVNAGIVEAFDAGIVTSASLMVRGVAVEDAVRLASARPRLSLGLHFDLGEWARDGDRWVEVYRVVDLGDEARAAAELGRQLGRFREWTGRAPTHLDSHQHVHLEEPVRSIVDAAARELGIPVRHLTPGIRYRGDFYGQDARGEPIPGALAADRLADLISDLPPGVTELACHPGRDPGLASPYRDERAREVDALVDPRVRRRIELEDIELISFAALLDERGTPSETTRERVA